MWKVHKFLKQVVPPPSHAIACLPITCAIIVHYIIPTKKNNETIEKPIVTFHKLKKKQFQPENSML
jgi:hypothetical protein